HGSELRRIPFWVEVSRPALASERHILLRRPGTYTGTTAGGATKVVRYRYPLADGAWPGPEVVYRIRITRRVANFGVAVTSGKAVPHVVYAGDENHLTGYAGLPRALNPYTAGFGDARPIAGAILPLPGLYDIVFDTRSVTAAGPFTFRYWVNDTTPPRLRLARRARRDGLARGRRRRCGRRPGLGQRDRRRQARRRDLCRRADRRPHDAGRARAARARLRLPGGEERRGRGGDLAQHRDVHRQRPGQQLATRILR